MNILLNKEGMQRLLLPVFFLLSSFSISHAQEYQHTLLKPYGFDMLATESDMLNFLSDFEVESYVYYNDGVYLTTIQPENQVMHEQLNLDYQVVLFKDEIMAIGLYNKDSSYRDFLVKQYGQGDLIDRNDSAIEFRWEIDGYIFRVFIGDESDFNYSIRSIEVDRGYNLLLEERAKTDPYF